MATSSRLSSLGRALADPNRAEILCMLASGTAHTAGELAQHVNRAPSTTSRHLSELIDAGLVVVEPAGRHRYFRLAGPEVGDLVEYIDQLELPELKPPVRPNPSSALAAARTCYDHVAGQLGVDIYRALSHRRMLERGADRTVLTDRGHDRLQSMGIDTTVLNENRRPLVRSCLDWTQRTHHLGGAVGAALLSHMLANDWIRRSRDKREVTVTEFGRTSLHRHFGIG